MFKSFRSLMHGRDGVADLRFHRRPIEIDPAGIFQYGDAGQQPASDQRGHFQKSTECPAKEESTQIAAADANYSRR